MHAVGHPDLLQRLLTPYDYVGNISLEQHIVSIPHGGILCLNLHFQKDPDPPYFKFWAQHTRKPARLGRQVSHSCH